MLPSPAMQALRREGFEVIHGGQKADFVEEMHAHDFDARIMVLGGEITIGRDGKIETFKAGDCCEIPETCQHTAKVGPEGVESCFRVSCVSNVRVPVCLTELRRSGCRLSVSSMFWLLRLPMPENMSVKLPPRLMEKSLSSSLGGVAVLA